MPDDTKTQPVEDNRPVQTTGVPASAPTAPADRRRPGRMHYASQALIALLRTPSELRTTKIETDRDDLAPAKGIASGFVLSILIWAAMGFLAWYILSSVL